MLTATQREQLGAIYADWCPPWSASWQRRFHLAARHVAAGRALPTGRGQLVVQGEDLGAFITAVLTDWLTLADEQRRRLTAELGLQAPTAPPAKVSAKDAKWAANLAALAQFVDREGHPRVPRTHVETLEGTAYNTGRWLANQRTRHTSLTTTQRGQLTALGIELPPATTTVDSTTDDR